MTIRQRLEEDMKAAMRAGQKERLACIRMLRSQLQAREVELRARHGRDWQIGDEEALPVVDRYAKQRREAIDSFRAGGREDLAARESEELEIVSAYLPEALGEDELRRIVSDAVAASGATSVRDLGAVMREVLPHVRGRADGKLVNRLVREALEAKPG